MVTTLLDDIYKKYKKTVNMSFSELKAWSKTDLSKKASLSRMPILRNLELLKTPKNKWKSKHIKWAIRTIGFVKRMKKIKRGKLINNSMSKRDIALKNWAYNFKKK